MSDPTSENDDSHDDEQVGVGAEEREQSPGAMPDADDVDTEAIEEERAERLDPENRPENVEIDNTSRDFDSEKGMFTDADGYDSADDTYDDGAV